MSLLEIYTTETTPYAFGSDHWSMAERRFATVGQAELINKSVDQNPRCRMPDRHIATSDILSLTTSSRLSRQRGETK
jgi:hypothetical protein